ncbi:FAD binding domain-containing protein [Aggregatilinea lenta]|uniref:FAD binding domain-containing protein n=1 Tax=Aggregatilinea lenta TaxID=913108 RepID=UPI0013C2E432|nr:FAD binding domain-containing protein [Aggregatilinea lenta]
MSLWNHYYTPTSVDDALALLAQYEGRARVIAGGTDLLLDIRQGHMAPPDALIDVTRIQGFDDVRQDGDTLFLGAGVTHTQIVQSSVITARATCLVESCGVVGGPQVRNVGTLGGNVAHALPAGDGTTSLVALDADAEIVQQGERRWVPIREMYLGPGVSLLDSTRDLLLGFRFALTRKGEATAFKRIMRPQGVALPILGCAVWMRVDDAGERIEDVRVCIGPVDRVPVRADEVEASLRGVLIAPDAFEHAVVVARDSLHPRTSKFRATAEYRVEMVETLLRRVLSLAAERARTGEAVPEGVGLE